MTGDYVVCINDGGCLVSLKVRKIYRRLPDDDGEQHGMIRIIDETAEDYLFPSNWFVPVELTVPDELQEATERALTISI